MKFLNIPLTFAGKMPATTYCTTYYGLQQMKEEQESLIQQKKIIDAAGIEPLPPR